MGLSGLCAHLLWPLSCPVCGRPAVPVCPECLDDLIEERGPRCVVCGADYPCREHPGLPPHYSGGSHEGFVRELVLELKYRNRRIIGRLLGQALGRALQLDGFDAIVPVPLHRGSPRAFNQALEISEGLGQVLGLTVADILSWRLEQSPQARSSAVQRRLLPAEAIVCPNPVFAGGRFILLDDVRTTGTTLLRGQAALDRQGLQVGAFVTWSSA